METLMPGRYSNHLKLIKGNCSLLNFCVLYINAVLVYPCDLFYIGNRGIKFDSTRGHIHAIHVFVDFPNFYTVSNIWDMSVLDLLYWYSKHILK